MPIPIFDSFLNAFGGTMLNLSDVGEKGNLINAVAEQPEHLIFTKEDGTTQKVSTADLKYANDNTGQGATGDITIGTSAGFWFHFHPDVNNINTINWAATDIENDSVVVFDSKDLTEDHTIHITRSNMVFQDGSTDFPLRMNSILYCWVHIAFPTLPIGPLNQLRVYTMEMPEGSVLSHIPVSDRSEWLRSSKNDANSNEITTRYNTDVKIQQRTGRIDDRLDKTVNFSVNETTRTLTITDISTIHNDTVEKAAFAMTGTTTTAALTTYLNDLPLLKTFGDKTGALLSSSYINMSASPRLSFVYVFNGNHGSDDVAITESDFDDFKAIDTDTTAEVQNATLTIEGNVSANEIIAGEHQLTNVGAKANNVITSLGNMVSSLGSWLGFTGTNYLNSVNTNQNALSTLDSEIKANRDRLFFNSIGTGRIATQNDVSLMDRVGSANDKISSIFNFSIFASNKEIAIYSRAGLTQTLRTLALRYILQQPNDTALNNVLSMSAENARTIYNSIQVTNFTDATKNGTYDFVGYATLEPLQNVGAPTGVWRVNAHSTGNIYAMFQRASDNEIMARIPEDDGWGFVTGDASYANGIVDGDEFNDFPATSAPQITDSFGTAFNGVYYPPETGLNSFSAPNTNRTTSLYPVFTYTFNSKRGYLKNSANPTNGLSKITFVFDGNYGSDDVTIDLSDFTTEMDYTINTAGNSLYGIFNSQEIMTNNLVINNGSKLFQLQIENDGTVTATEL